MSRKRLVNEAESYRLPRPPQPTVNAAAFCLYPLVLPPDACPQQFFALQMLYKMAFEQAQAVARPSILERDLLAVWN
jgi:hypothetical protein